MSKYTQREWERVVGWGKVPPEYKHEESDNDESVQTPEDKSTRDKKRKQLTEFVYTKHQTETFIHLSQLFYLQETKRVYLSGEKRVGNDVANYVARTDTVRGTYVHHMCEDYLNNDFDEEKHKRNFYLILCLLNLEIQYCKK